MSTFQSESDLDEVYPQPHPLAKSKAISFIDPHSETFINHSPLAMVSSVDESGFPDVSPRGGKPGFVKVLDKHTLAFADSAGNNRLDTYRNLVKQPQVGILFTIPGIEEVLRVKGSVSLSRDPEVLEAFAEKGKPAKLVVMISVKELFFHCAKALMLAKPWDSETHVDRDVLPSLLQIIKDQQALATSE
ncbi:pyridoxamine 5'-phosphate oxidase family protein [Vibrio sp. AK197]|uniref:MSMEG_1061 family FMN-dependent PPOX-type flavoprotein n=1 Tax=Vibrio olivae TaxID=1243002 RepID=A0ABV5HJZ6_9VIBR